MRTLNKSDCLEVKFVCFLSSLTRRWYTSAVRQKFYTYSQILLYRRKGIWSFWISPRVSDQNKSTIPILKPFSIFSLHISLVSPSSEGLCMLSLFPVQIFHTLGKKINHVFFLTCLHTEAETSVCHFFRTGLILCMQSEKKAAPAASFSLTPALTLPINTMNCPCITLISTLVNNR